MDTNQGTYTYTGCNNQKYKVPIELVTSLSQLHKGDHITNKRVGGLYWHHAVVEHVEIEKGIFTVLEYSSSAKEFLRGISSSSENPGIAQVVRGEYQLQDGLYLIKHEDCLPREAVVLRARKRLEEKEYDPFGNNCEHFAMWCKTNIKSSEQVNNLLETIIKNLLEEIVKFFILLPFLPNSTSAGVSLGVRMKWEVGVERVLAAYDINCAKADLRAGQITQMEYNDAISKRIMVSTCSVAGSIAGEHYGEGEGRLAGRFLGGLAGRFLELYCGK
ncbi:uncharacterized protein LOC141866359 [Acropora palmata]|uniref:uncharacterized protein LOC141866359 n=1 Tax=Acropora palmata TaxID=6131 RepID=UPI003DA10B38